MGICVEDSSCGAADCQALGSGLTVSIVICTTVPGEVRRFVNDRSGLSYTSRQNYDN